MSAASRKAAPRAASPTVVSGGLLKMFGLGVLIVGDSGVGKSESSIELIARGHRFISDDVVEVRRTAGGRIIGRAPRLSRYFMELRGLGIINVRYIFGPKSILEESVIDLVIQLKKWTRKKEYDRLGLRFPEDHVILGIRIPQLNIPVAPGRNIATLIEVACVSHLLQKRGRRAPEQLIRRLDRALLASEGRGKP
jgi:HPr kinase/phosphorylase